MNHHPKIFYKRGEEQILVHQVGVVKTVTKQKSYKLHTIKDLFGAITISSYISIVLVVILVTFSGNGSSSEPENQGDFITILSIDGGGVRGIIPSEVLSALESKLQEKSPIIFPNEAGKSLLKAHETIPFLVTEGDVRISDPDPEATKQLLTMHPEVLINTPAASLRSIIDIIISLFPQLKGYVEPLKKILLEPKYDGKNLQDTIKGLLGEKLALSETLTSVIIPAFDIKEFRPTIFSTLKAKRDRSMDAPLADVCRATSAAPYYFPPYNFETSKPFNLVDGGVAANNPTFLAVCEAMKEQKTDFHKFVILSLGTGAANESGKLEVGDGEWGIADWLWQDDNSTPLLDILMTASDEMTEMYMSKVFQYSGLEHNYTRIQVELKQSEAKMDNSSKENLEMLEKIGQNLAKNNDAKLEE
ncbi:hypothetical protein DKX38_029058 [Salix brachista]|uniref:Patatin n=1 Tax=Salix brachista TaxID=2182728 RepID=A0A5N5J1S9_9ROSI|nr:hypothetical protein DKX38_029058 [Salix brachista]